MSYLIQHPVQLISSFNNAISIIAVHHKNKPLCVLEVVSPQMMDFVLATNIPDSEADILVFHGFDVKPDGGNGGNNLSKLELVQNGGLTNGRSPYG